MKWIIGIVLMGVAAFAILANRQDRQRQDGIDRGLAQTIFESGQMRCVKRPPGGAQWLRLSQMQTHYEKQQFLSAD